MMLLPCFCKELEEGFGTQFTDKIVGGDGCRPDQHERGEKVIGQLDREKRILAVAFTMHLSIYTGVL